MRDINRIPKICKELEQLWLQHPDLRLGQIFDSLSGYLTDDMFYAEDNELIENLRRMLK